MLLLRDRGISADQRRSITAIHPAFRGMVTYSYGPIRSWRVVWCGFRHSRSGIT